MYKSQVLLHGDSNISSFLNCLIMYSLTLNLCFPLLLSVVVRSSCLIVKMQR